MFISLQALIFVPDPYFNEPGYEASINTPQGKAASDRYNKNINIQTLNYAILYPLKLAINTPDRTIFKVIILTHFALKKADLLVQLTQWGLSNSNAGKHYTYTYIYSYTV